MHRRDDARRVPQVHREGRGARAALPARHGRGADARGDRRDPPRRSASATSSTTRWSITDDAVRAAADLSTRYITDRHLPDKAIDLIDEAGSRRPAPPLVRAARPARGPEGPGADHQGEGRRDQRAGVRAGGHTARGRGHGTRDRRALRERLAVAGVHRDPAGRRGGHRPGRRDVDRDPGHPHRRGGVRAAAPHGGRPPRPRHRAAGGDRDRSRRPSAVPARASRIPSGPSARSSSWGPPASGRRSSPRPSPSSCSAPRTR